MVRNIIGEYFFFSYGFASSGKAKRSMNPHCLSLQDGFLCVFCFVFLVGPLSMLCLEYLTFISGAVFIYTLLPIALGLVSCPQSSDSHSSPGLTSPRICMVSQGRPRLQSLLTLQIYSFLLSLFFCIQLFLLLSSR